MERTEVAKEYLKTVGSIILVEGTSLWHDIRELNLCQELGETSCGLVSLFLKAGHHMIKRLVINIPAAIYETTMKTIGHHIEPEPATAPATSEEKEE